MYKLNEELKTRLFWNFYFHPRTNGNHFSVLNEMHGLSNTIVDLSNIISSKVFNEYKKTVSNSLTNRDYENKIFVINERDIKNSFVQSIDVRVTVGFRKTSKVLLNAAYIGSRTYVNKKEGLFGNIVITCNIVHPLPNSFEKVFRKGHNVSKMDGWQLYAMLSHELTHAYEDYQRMFNAKNPTSLGKAVNTIGYGKNTAQDDENADLIVRKLSWVMYHLTPSEINAYVAHLITEVRPQLLDCDNSNAAWNIVRSSNIWKKYESTETYLYDIIGVNDIATQQQLLTYWNETRGRNFNSFDKLCNVLKKKWINCRNKIINQISKQITDIAMSSDNWSYMDGKNISKTQL